MTNTSTLSSSSQEMKPFIETIYKKAGTVINLVLVAYFCFGLFLAFFYDTWFIAISVGGLCLAACYLSKILLPAHTLYQYVISAILAVFMAQFIYQMHGMFEMHFFAFLGAVLLITYQNWKLQIPLILLIVVHHAGFAYLQYAGFKEVYFTQLDYMTLEAFLFHAALAAAIVFICGLWAFQLHRSTLENASNTLQLRHQLRNMEQNIAFAEFISKGNQEAEHNFTAEDKLGIALSQMRSSLLQARQKEEQDRFTNVGLAEISEMLRNSGLNTQELSIQLISKLVKYIGVNQGGLFIVENPEQPQLVLSGCYAYDRVKHLKKTIEAGEGLLGQVLLEKDTIYITELPAEYIQITSGLGKANPTCILIIPLKTNDTIVGAIEMASFTEIPAYKISFLEKIGESIAATIVSARVNQQTTKLLDEFQVMNEQMRSQEEEMRQNMEELQATQEELQRKVEEYNERMHEKDRRIKSLEGKLNS
ncbi:GAF domain-containing protein [Rhodocytophaga rosea]|uniref:GAF domain-containing protein n=1 Tax=Rhodocytophaga rosea TaxID=2704465 RepID=A0A6C0GLW5_9BACT|nr:GAF domain-containing protein [Rhodocytophaga rosea]QHT68612.1 GAF domain-containing protein [Rhodocytophaga rosea]